ncbi:hypothetical protein CR513_49017, partial [Mucuna pruriens]
MDKASLEREHESGSRLHMGMTYPHTRCKATFGHAKFLNEYLQGKKRASRSHRVGNGRPGVDKVRELPYPETYLLCEACQKGEINQNLFKKYRFHFSTFGIVTHGFVWSYKNIKSSNSKMLNSNHYVKRTAFFTTCLHREHLSKIW